MKQYAYHTQRKCDAAYDRFIELVEKVAEDKAVARLRSNVDLVKAQEQSVESWAAAKKADDLAENFRALLNAVLEDDITTLSDELLDRIRAAVALPDDELAAAV